MSLLLPSHAQFKDVSNEWGYSGGGKAAFADYNGDGFIDLFASKLWRNEKGEKFVDAIGDRDDRCGYKLLTREEETLVEKAAHRSFPEWAQMSWEDTMSGIRIKG